MKIIVYVLLLACVANSSAQNKNYVIEGTIFDNPPDSIPKIFGKGIISITDRFEYGLAISPTWDEVFFTAEEPGDGLMVMRKLADRTWTQPEVADLRKNKSWEFEAFYSPNGEKLFFSSNVNDTSRIWFADKEKNKWSLPKLLDSPVNSTPVFWATVSDDNTMYYTNLSVFRIYKSILVNNKYSKTENLGLPFGAHPFVSRDGNFILFNGKGDIYITFKDKNEKWSNPIKLGILINTSEYNETCPSLSPDEKYIFFSRYNDLNEKSDIYWVSSGIIEKIRKQVFK
ncbi:MAG: PD40 domain-containing protein [Bacteroidia bacterium]|nr:PD40 domain-containing protein [Bacteroidia bacterium]